MGVENARPARITQLRATVARFLLPDTCRVYPPQRVMTSAGAYKDELGPPLHYNGLPSIPCRIDVTRYYRQVTMFGQEGIVSDFEINFPWDFPIKHDHKIEIDGQFYEVRKLMDAEERQVTRAALVSRIGRGTKT